MIRRKVLTDADGRYTIAGVPVGTHCEILCNVVAGSTQHVGFLNLEIKQSGAVAAPDLVLTQPVPRRRTRRLQNQRPRRHGNHAGPLTEREAAWAVTGGDRPLPWCAGPLTRCCSTPQGSRSIAMGFSPW